MAYNYIISKLPIYRAALLDDWESVSGIFAQDPDLMTKPIGYCSETPLIIAVGSNRSQRFMQKLVERIVAVGAADKLFLRTSDGDNALHYAAKVGNVTAARLLLAQNPSMAHGVDGSGSTPLKVAAWHGQKETIQYLLTVTSDISAGEGGVSPYSGVAGGDLITLTIMSGFYDVALKIINMHPNIVLEYDGNRQTALQVLALKPENFLSGSGLGFWGRLIYSCKFSYFYVSFGQRQLWPDYSSPFCYYGWTTHHSCAGFYRSNIWIWVLIFRSLYDASDSFTEESRSFKCQHLLKYYQ